MTRQWFVVSVDVDYGWLMRCHVCDATETKVVDSRAAESGEAIRRRRECATCGSRFTTFERVEEAVLVVVKRDGARTNFRRDKLIGGMVSAAKGRPIADEIFAEVATSIEDLVKANGGHVTSDFIGLAVLEHLRSIDEVAALRFASVYKNFDTVSDFEREATLIKREAAPRKSSTAAADSGQSEANLEVSLN